jgi:hypothetical protein
MLRVTEFFPAEQWSLIQEYTPNEGIFRASSTKKSKTAHLPVYNNDFNQPGTNFDPMNGTRLGNFLKVHFSTQEDKYYLTLQAEGNDRLVLSTLGMIHPATA